MLDKKIYDIHPLEHRGVVSRRRARGSLHIDCRVLALRKGVVEQPDVAVACGQMQHSDVRAHRLHDLGALVYEELGESKVLLCRRQEERRPELLVGLVIDELSEDLGTELLFDKANGLSVLLADCRVEKRKVILLIFGVEKGNDTFLLTFVRAALLFGGEVFGQQSREFAIVFGLQRIENGAA